MSDKPHVKRIRSIKVTVCDKCFRACCWQGIFLCDEAYSAGTVNMTIGELLQIKDCDGETPEHPSYYKNSLV